MLMKLLGDNNAKNINGERRSSERDLLLLCWIYHTDSVVRDKEVFGKTKLTIISQAFQHQRLLPWNNKKDRWAAYTPSVLVRQSPGGD